MSVRSSPVPCAPGVTLEQREESETVLARGRSDPVPPSCWAGESCRKAEAGSAASISFLTVNCLSPVALTQRFSRQSCISPEKGRLEEKTMEGGVVLGKQWMGGHCIRPRLFRWLVS